MRRIVRLAAILNLTYFGVEFAVALAIGSVSLFADSIDFLEDTALNSPDSPRAGLERAVPGTYGHGLGRGSARPRSGDPLSLRRLHLWRFRSREAAPLR
jgi:hypothetical protein